MTDAKFNYEDMFRALIREELERAGRRDSSKRVTFQEDERKYLVGWLPDDLGRRADQIKKFVEVLYEDNEKQPPLKHYTPHGISHCKAVEDNLHRLIPNELHRQFTEKEKFFLIIAAWVHDIGMMRGIFHDDDRREDDYIRDFHHERSEKYLANHYKLLGINEDEAATLGLLARFHRRRCNIDECPYYLTISNKDTVRIRLMAAYLRLADALHIDQSRTPDNQYAISLAYNIPYKSKLHWYRSKFVHGIRVDTEEKSIIVQVKQPKIHEDDEKYKDKKYTRKLKEKYDMIYNTIIDDLNEEIESVKNVLFMEGITYFLSARKEIISVEVDDIFRKDVEPVLHYYHLLDNPSSSALVSLVLDAIEGISSSEENCNSDKDIDLNSATNKRVKERISEFLKEIERNVLSSRKCHGSLLNLIKEIKEEVVENDKIIQCSNNSIISISCWVKNKKETIDRCKHFIRYNSARYLHKNFSKLKEIVYHHFSAQIYKIITDYKIYFPSFNDTGEQKYDKEKNKINVMLYGYSELSIETLCGFRDAVSTSAASKYREHKCSTASKYGEEKCINDTKNEEAAVEMLFYQYENIDNFKNEASSCFRIFCCEGQPKNHTTWNGRYHHHDGSMYAVELAKKRLQGNIYNS